MACERYIHQRQTNVLFTLNRTKRSSVLLLCVVRFNVNKTLYSKLACSIVALTCAKNFQFNARFCSLNQQAQAGLTQTFFSGLDWLSKFQLELITKGQLILKCLFGCFTFFQKTNKNKSTSSKVEFVRSFFGKNLGLKK